MTSVFRKNHHMNLQIDDVVKIEDETFKRRKLKDQYSKFEGSYNFARKPHECATHYPKPGGLI